jgi:3-oxoacyl-[acyl-carrier-protein] synthase-3
MQYRAKITGVNGFLPEYVLTNAELESLVETNDEWIFSRTGIKERRILKNEGSVFMATQAVKALLRDSNLDSSEIDLVICATITPDHITPAAANLVSYQIGAVNAFSFDMNAACSGFLYALITASQYIETGKCRNVVVVGVDKMSSITDYTDRNTCILFGDGAGAVLLQRSSDESGIIDSILKTDGIGLSDLCIKAGGSLHPATLDTVNNREHFVYQNGKTVFKMAVSKMTEVVLEIMKKNKLSANDVSWLVPHQANLRIIKAVAEFCDMPLEKVMVNIENVGNTTGATIPLCLWENKNKIKKGDRVIVTTFGGGYTWGAAYMIW